MARYTDDSRERVRDAVDFVQEVAARLPGATPAWLLHLRLAGPEERVKLDFIVLLTVQTMNFLHSGRHRVAL